MRRFPLRRDDSGAWRLKDDLATMMAVAVDRVIDTTGAGDLFAAGMLYGLENGLDWETSGRVASLLGAIKIEHHGPQQHHFTVDQFKDRFGTAFGRAL